MQRSDRWPEEYEPGGGSRSGSRRGSACLSRRSSAKKEKEKEREVKKKSPVHQPGSATATPKKAKPQNLEFVVTGKQCLKKSDRANSLPGYHRRPSADKTKKLYESPKRTPHANTSHSSASKSRETSLEDDMSLDLSQVSDFEDTSSKYGIRSKFAPLAASTAKARPKPRSGSLQSPLTRVRGAAPGDSPHGRHASVASVYRYGVSTDLDYSSVSPEYSGQSSADMSPRVADLPTPRSQEPHLSSCCGTSWQDCSSLEQTVGPARADGEWSQFWANYNNSLAEVPAKGCYDQCPTPYREETLDLQDLEFSPDGSLKRSPSHLDEVTRAIRREGLRLTPRETRTVLQCARVLGAALASALQRGCREHRGEGEAAAEDKEEDPEVESKKKTLTLDLKETNEPAELGDKQWETVTTQTDISLPNTKSAPRIFEKILKQLSRTSLDEGLKAMEAKAMECKAMEAKVMETKTVETKPVESKVVENLDKADVKKENGN